jgi:hypothetical protein
MLPALVNSTHWLGLYQGNHQEQIEFTLQADAGLTICGV